VARQESPVGDQGGDEDAVLEGEIASEPQCRRLHLASGVVLVESHEKIEIGFLVALAAGTRAEEGDLEQERS